jgi:Trk K+ transport system NAD-binding subunit
VFERKVPHRELDGPIDEGVRVDVLLIGLGRFGSAVASHLSERGSCLLAVDFDPELVKRHTADGYRVHYGDAEDPEFIASLPLDQVKWVVSTVRDHTINRILLHALQQQGYKGRVAIASSGRHDARLFEREGVDLVLIPYDDAAKEAADRLMAHNASHNQAQGDFS